MRTLGHRTSAVVRLSQQCSLEYGELRDFGSSLECVVSVKYVTYLYAADIEIRQQLRSMHP